MPLYLALQHFYPRSPRGERHTAFAILANGAVHFYPRSPRGERRFLPAVACQRDAISIHAPRVGSDGFVDDSDRSLVIHFYPRSPRGERHHLQQYGYRFSTFLSTLPAWGATFDILCNICVCVISIHAPRVGSDPHAGFSVPSWRPISIHAPRVGSDYPAARSESCTCHFYPRSPRGERLWLQKFPLFLA